MATIRPNDNAPAEAVKYIFPTATFDLDVDGSYETTDRDVLAQAEAHPWLAVEYEAVEEAAYTRLSRSVPAVEDPFTSVGPGAGDAFDPEKVRAAEEAKAEDAVQPLAVDAGLDQSEDAVEGGVAESLSVDRESEEVAPVPVNDEPADDAGEER